MAAIFEWCWCWDIIMYKVGQSLQIGMDGTNRRRSEEPVFVRTNFCQLTEFILNHRRTMAISKSKQSDEGLKFCINCIFMLFVEILFYLISVANLQWFLWESFCILLFFRDKWYKVVSLEFMGFMGLMRCLTTKDKYLIF